VPKTNTLLAGQKIAGPENSRATIFTAAAAVQTKITIYAAAKINFFFEFFEKWF
jgi:hypothetical protein